METPLKTGFAQIFSCCPKNLSCPNFGGAAAPLAPPARTPIRRHFMISGQNAHNRVLFIHVAALVLNYPDRKIPYATKFS